jgi:hypothetical protein
VRERDVQKSGKGDIISQQITLTQQPQRVPVAVPISYQTVKAEVYEPIAKILDSKWERDYYVKEDFDGYAFSYHVFMKVMTIDAHPSVVDWLQGHALIESYFQSLTQKS